MKQHPCPGKFALSFWLLLFILPILFTQVSCHKSPPVSPTPPVDSVSRPDTVKPVKKDTVWAVSSLEEDYNEANPNQVIPNRLFRFYFDSSMRVTAVGISNFGNVLLDTSTCRLFYNGGNSKPYMIIAPSMISPPSGPATYDTTWFVYNSANQILMDSSIEHVYYQYPSFSTQPMKRVYSYPDASTTLIQWYDETTAGGSPQIIRTDSMAASGGELQNIRTDFYTPNSNVPPPTYALAQTFQYTNFINPLSQLNIGGTIFSLIYTPSKLEILGNNNSKAVSNTNILPYYLDFYSPKVPSSFYLGGFSGDFLIGSMYDRFDIQVIADTALPQLPKQLSVGATTALGALFIYKFSYFTVVK